MSLSLALVGLVFAGCGADNNCAGGAERDASGQCVFNDAVGEVGSPGAGGQAGAAGSKAGAGGQSYGGTQGDKVPVGGSAGSAGGGQWPVGGSAGSAAAGAGGSATAGTSGTSGQSGQGQAGQGEAGQNGEAGTGQAGQGEAGQGQAGQGEAGQGQAGQGEAGQGQAGGGSVATSYCKPTLPPLTKEYPKEQVMFYWVHDGRAVRSNEFNGILFGEQQDPGNGSWSFSGRGWLIATGGIDPNDALSFAVDDPRLGWTPPPMPEKTYSDGEYLFSWAYKNQPVHARIKNGTLYANYQNEDGTWSFASSGFLSNLADNLPYLHWRCFAQNEP